MNKIFIYGVPGSGKTYISQKMSKELSLPLFEADTLKDELRKLISKEESPFLYLSTYEGYKYFGELNEENAVKGLKSVRQVLAERVALEIDKHAEVLMEGAFLDPNLLKDNGKMILIVTTDEEQHRKQFFQHREENEASKEDFKSVRMIQEFLIKEAKELEIEIKKNE